MGVAIEWLDNKKPIGLSGPPILQYIIYWTTFQGVQLFVADR